MESKSIDHTRFVNLPVYSVAQYGPYWYFAGGGGGKTGIANELHIYEGRVTKAPLKVISTGEHILQNMIALQGESCLIGSQNESVVIYRVEDGGLTLRLLHTFRADYSFKHATVQAMHYNEGVLVVGGEDKYVRFYNISGHFSETNLPIVTEFQYKEHNWPVRCLHSNEVGLYASTDARRVVLMDYRKRVIIRRYECDSFHPNTSNLQSAYFLLPCTPELIIVHFTFKTNTFVTKTNNDRFTTIQVANDQSCLSTHKANTLGIACGNGSTVIVDTKALRVVSQEKKLSFVVTASMLTRNGQLVSATPECTYFVQSCKTKRSMGEWPILTIVVLLLQFLLVSLIDLPELPSK